jgi:hypothetical protein
VVYLIKREVKELVASIAAKCNLNPTKILRVIHVNQKGRNIKVDDDIVREIPEGQDMILKFSSITAPPNCEWNVAVNVVFDSKEVNTVQNGIQGYELRLIF